MQENGTVQQLSKALNQLLNAYEILQEEAKNLKDENVILKKEVDDLQLKNSGLDSRLSALNDTTKHNSNEMDTMLGRIETILGPNIEEIKEEIIEEIESTIEKPKEVLTEKSLYSEEEVTKEKEEDNKEIDLGRMQSLLNGFSN